MPKYIKGLVLFIIASCAAASAHASGDMSVALPQHGILSFTVPSGWIGKIQRARDDLPPTVILTPDHGTNFQVLVTPIWPANSNVPPLTEELLRREVRSAADRVKSQSVERDLPVVSLTAPGIFGAYFSSTDKNPEPNGFRHMSQGMLSLKELRVTFTVLVNDDSTRITNEAIQMLKALRLAPEKTERQDAIKITDNERNFELTVPVSKLTLLLPKQGVYLQQAGNATSNRYFLFKDSVRNINISGWFEPSERFQGTKKMWESSLGAGVGKPNGPTNVEFSKIGNWEVVSYSMALGDHSMANVRADLSQSGTWIELHLSSVKNIPATEQYEMLASFIRSIQIQEKP